MDAREYQRRAARTICNMDDAIQRMAGPNAYPVTFKGDAEDHSIVQSYHGAAGAAKESGELLQLLEKHVYYGKPLDRVKVGEEIGDTLWYLAELCTALGLNMGRLMEANIAKLMARYPEKFTYHHADRDNRDLDKERQALEQDAKQHQVKSFASLHNAAMPPSIEEVNEALKAGYRVQVVPGAVVDSKNEATLRPLDSEELGRKFLQTGDMGVEPSTVMGEEDIHQVKQKRPADHPRPFGYEEDGDEQEG